MCMMLNVLIGRAQENVLQIAPATVGIGVSKASIDLQMNNTDPYLAMQFDIYFPEGMTLADGKKPFGSLSKKRFPYTEDYDEEEDVTTYTFEHAVEFRRKTGFCRFVISPNTVSFIKGNSGSLVKLYVQTSADMKPGIYPIVFKGVVFTKYDGRNTYSIRPPELTSYVVVGESGVGSSLDFSSWNGYVPSDVMEGLNTMLSSCPQLAEVDLSGIDDAGQPLSLANPNAVVYVKGQSDFSVRQKEKMRQNVVEGNVCEELALTDGSPVSFSKEFVAQRATYRRSVPSAGWYSLCLPFDAEAQDGVGVERYASVDEAAHTITFSDGCVEANKPCIFSTTATDVEFAATNVTVNSTVEAPADGPFIGTYSQTLAGSIAGCYALRSDGSGFGKADGSAYVTPFRGYLDFGQMNVGVLKLLHGGETTDLGSLSSDKDITVRIVADGVVVCAKGKPVSESVFGVDGKKVASVALLPGESTKLQLQAGVYVINNVKFKIGRK